MKMDLTLSVQKNLNSDYSVPVVPVGFDQPVAFSYADGSIALDFICHKTCVFASEILEIAIPHPWQPEYNPTAEEWESIGFLPIYE